MSVRSGIRSAALLLASVMLLSACGKTASEPVPDADPYEAARQEIEEAMSTAVNTVPRVVEYPDMDLTTKKYSHIHAITYDGLDRHGMKTKAFAYISFPYGCTEESPVPAVVLVPGGTSHPVHPEWMRTWNNRGYAAILLDTSGSFPTERDIDLHEDDPDLFVYGLSGIFDEEGYTDAPAKSLEHCDGPVEDMWLTYAVSDTILAANVLRADPRVNPDQVGINGISWGGVVSSISIAYDNRFAFAIPVYGSAFLGEQLAGLRENFESEGFRQLWAAEKRYESVTVPVLWLCSNNDDLFSINSNSDSYLATMNGNPLTRLSIQNNFIHAHGYAYNRPDNYTFAASAVKGGPKIAVFLEQPAGREIRVKTDVSGRAPLKATLFYLTGPMTYGLTDPDGYLDEEWKTIPLDYDEETHLITGTVPGDAAGYYIEVREDKEISTSAYVALD